MNSKSEKKNKTLRGYVQNTNFGPYSLPVSFQNKLLKQYCEEKNKKFALPQGEIVFSKNYIQLKSIIKKIKNKEGLVMMSIFMLPHSKLDRTIIFKNLVKKKIECHFLIENIIAKTKNDYTEINNIFKFSNFQKNSTKIFNSIKKL